MTSKIATLATLATLAFAAPGCIFTSGSGSDSEAGDDAADALRECGDDSDIAEEVRITEEYGQSLHEMVACGGLAVALCNGVVSGIINAIIEQSNDATPDAWSYESGGTYRTSGEGVVMTTQFFAAADFSFAASGELITENVFLTENYLVGATVNVDLSTGATTLSFSGTGPLVELLGYGAEPESPISLSFSDIGEIEGRLGTLEFEADVLVDDVREAGTITYHTTTPRLPVQALLTGAGMRYDLIEADGAREELGQSLVVDEWSIEFVDEGGGALNGSSEFRVVGGAFDYAGVTAFENSTFPETTLTCP